LLINPHDATMENTGRNENREAERSKEQIHKSIEINEKLNWQFFNQYWDNIQLSLYSLYMPKLLYKLHKPEGATSGELATAIVEAYLMSAGGFTIEPQVYEQLPPSVQKLFTPIVIHIPEPPKKLNWFQRIWNK
jgi:hypothetical protein